MNVEENSVEEIVDTKGDDGVSGGEKDGLHEGTVED